MRNLFAFSKKQRIWRAEWCPICQDVQRHEIHSFRYEPQFTLLQQCCGCDCWTPLDPNDVVRPATEPSTPLKELVERTNPHLPANVLSHLAWLRKARSQAADPSTRAGIMRIPMQAANLDFTGPTPFYAKSRLGPFDTLKVVGVILCLIALYSLAVTWSAALAKQLNKSELLGFSPCLILLLGPIGFFLARWRFNSRRARTRTAPMLARGYCPLKPTIQEVEEQIAWANLSGMPVARKLEAAHIHQLSLSIEDTSLRNADELQFEVWGRKIILDHQIQEAFDRAIESEDMNKPRPDDPDGSHKDSGQI